MNKHSSERSKEANGGKRPLVPRHVAIIMDGNRRWASSHGLSDVLGHEAGAERVLEVVRAAVKCGVKYLTIFSFSTENWKRSAIEVAHLMALLRNNLLAKKEELVQEGIRLTMIGRREGLPPALLEAVEEVEEATQYGEAFRLTLAINYGGRDEICRAVRKIAHEIAHGQLQQDQIDEALLTRYLDTAALPDPDLLIRTGGERRLSNFLLWQTSYAEVYITGVHWPAFSATCFFDALEDYAARQRRMGE